MTIDLANWMSFVSGSLRLSELSIPGTHDSASTIQQGVDSGERLRLSTQTRGLRAQMEGGIRFLDLRCANVNDEFVLRHEKYNLNLSFARARDICRQFLADHPGETIVVSVKEESTSTGAAFARRFERYVQETPGLWYLNDAIPALSQVRGKLVLFRRFQASTVMGINAFNDFPDNATGSIPPSGRPKLRIQDEFGLLMTEIIAKQAAVERLLDEAASSQDRDVLYVNFTSAAGIKQIDFPLNAASFINPKVHAYLGTLPRGSRLGILPRDFEAIDFRSPEPDSIDATNTLIIESIVDYYFLRNKRDVNVVDFKDGADGTTLIAFPQKTSGTDNQIVQFLVSATPPYFFIANRLTGNVIDIQGPAAAPGSSLIASARKTPGADTQLWMLVPSDDPEYFFIASKVKGAGVITIQGPKRPGETPLVLAPPETPAAASQLWAISFR